MQLVLNLVSSVSIKRKKPWPKLSWIGQEQDGLYILDGKRISQLYIPSGKTKKKISKLHGLMNDVCALNVSQNGEFLCGALCDGKIFLWDRDHDKIQFITGLPKVFNDADKGNTKNQIFFSPCGNMMLLMMGFEKLFLWQKSEKDDPDDSHNLIGMWSQVHHGEFSRPNHSNTEATVDGVFYSDKVVGRCGSFSYVFNKGTELVVTTLMVKSCNERNVSNLAHNIPNQDGETISREVVEKVKCSIKWKTMTRPLYSVTPASRVVKGRYIYVCRYSPDGQMLAIVLNQKLAKNTRLLFCSTLHSTSRIVDMKCCGGSDQSCGRTWWVSDIAWTNDSLFLLGITRNGAIFITTKLGEPIKLITTGHGMDLGPSLFLTLHPRITVKSFQENIPPDNSEISSGSEKDNFHQKFSVAVHSSQPLVLCSDGYMVTIFHFNSQPGYGKVITELTKNVSWFLSSDATLQELEQTAGNLSAHGVSAFMAKFGKDEYSSPGSTLSETTSGFGLARDVEAGVISFGEIVGNKNSSLKIEEMNDQQRLLKAEYVLLQGLGIGTSCGRHWSQDMTVAMNLVIHTWVKLFTVLLENESNCSLSDSDTLFHSILTFVQSCFEAFRWDIVYQHCLPWFTQFAHATVKCLVSSKKFGFREIIDVCMKILRKAEEFLHEIYTWAAVSNNTTVHFLGDSFLPSCDTHDVPKSSASNSVPNDPASYVNLDYKLDQSWLTLYHYVCKMYKASLKTQRTSDEGLVRKLCWIQNKLQTMNTSRNLITDNKTESLSDQGFKQYLDGNYSKAAALLERSFHENSEDTKDTLEMSLTDLSERPLISRFGASLIEDDLVSKFSTDVDTLLSILFINLENYDLKAALTLVYSFLDTTRGVSLQGLHETGEALIPADEVKITPSSSLNVLQLSVLVKYPLAWVVDNRAIPVVQQLARFMACYFTNLPLVIPTPFRYAALPPKQSNKGDKVHTRTVKNLSQQRLTEVIGQQKLEGIWTADHTMELLLISGLVGEAAWFASCLGDWKIAFLLSVTEQFRQKNQSYVEKTSHVHASMPVDVPEPEQLMKERINIVLKLDESMLETDVEGTRELFDDEHISRLENVLEASVIADVNLVPAIIKQLVVMLKKSISKLDWMVPQDLYLPAPPLYCPQPARNDGDVLGEETRKEISLRTEIAIVVQKILAIYKASRCFLYCAQEYCKHVVRNSSDNRTLPNIINELITTEGIYIARAENEDSDYKGVIRSFQEFCSLMWLLDVRNELALASRQYSKLKQKLPVVDNDEQGQDVINQCEVVLVWLQRLLPFSDFFNAADDILDGILTMLSELPLNHETVDLLARYFHSPTLSIPTTEKLNRMTRKIRNKASASGLETRESLTARFQQQCEKRRKETEKSFVQPRAKNFLEVIPAFCRNVEYELDFAFLRFLDTFLLITLAKTITSEDYKKTPLILPYKDKPSLEVKSFEKTTRRNRTISRKSSFGIQRSQSFQDVGSIRKKPEVNLLSPDDSNKLVNRCNSLTDLRNVKPSTFSEELQAFLPTLLWLKRWCLIEEHQKGSANKSYFSLNTTSTAIRIQLPLKLVVNTLWLIDNYYKEFAQSKGKCLRKKCLKKTKRTSKKGEIKENVVDEEIKQVQDSKLTIEKEAEIESANTENGELQSIKNRKKVIGESSRATDVENQNEQMHEVGQSELQVLEDKRACDTVQERFETVDQEVAGKSQPQLREKERRKRKRMLKDSKQPVSETGDRLEKEECRRESGNETREETDRRKVELPKQRMGKRKEKTVNALCSLNHEEEGAGLSSQSNGEISRKQRTFVESEKSLSFRKAVRNQTDERETLDGRFYEPSSTEHIPSTSKIKKNLFPSLSSVHSNWRSLESVDENIPLLSFTHLDGARNVSDEKLSQMMSDTDVSGVVGIYSSAMGDDEVSLTSDSLSVGQIPSDVAIQMMTAADVNVDDSVAKKRDSNHRKTAKRQIYDESSSYESSEKARFKHDGSLLRRIIRSEMRKFIRTQQAEIRSSTSIIRTENENFSNEESKVKPKTNQERSMSYRKNRNKKSDEFKHRSSQTPFTDSSGHTERRARNSLDSFEIPSSHTRKQAMTDQSSEVASHHTERRARNSPDSFDIPSAHKRKQAMTDQSSEVASPRPGRQALNNKDSQIPSAHTGGGQTMNNQDFEIASAPVRGLAMRSKDSEVPSAHTGRQTMDNQGYGYQPPTNENDTGNEYEERLHATMGRHDVVQNPPQIFPPMANQLQFPTFSGWPIWYNPAFPSVPPWMYPGTANKENSDKGTQVEEENDHERQVKKSVDDSDNQDNVRHEIKDQIASVAIQTDILDVVKASTKDDPIDQESFHGQAPLLLFLNNQPNIRDKNHERENRSPRTEQASVTSNDQEKLSQKYDVFPKSLVREDEARHLPRNSVSGSNDDPFTMPLLNFPSEVYSPAVQSLPFKIAWPEHVQASEEVELPLLQLGDEQRTERLSFPVSSTEQRPPLLHFADRDNEVEDFHFVQVPANEDFHFLYLPETATELAKFEDSYGGDTKKLKQTGKHREYSENSEVARISTARIKRRNQLAGHVTTGETIKAKQPLSKQTFSDSPSSEREEHSGTRIQSAERKAASDRDQSKKKNDRGKKTKPRRDKLKELNNIIRDLQRDITNDDDLVVSEVSSILSPAIRYENFERKPEVNKRGLQDASKVTSELSTTSMNDDRKGQRHSGHYDTTNQKPIPVTRLYKPSTLSARDIHTEIPSDVPEQSKPVDVKVGTDNVLRFPVSVQTDTVISPPDVKKQPPSPRPRDPSVQRRAPRVQTKEFSIQTEPEVKTLPATSDVAINTENVEDNSNPTISLYPRVPADVYLDIQDVNLNSPEAASTKPGVPDQTARFLSVVDIAEERKQIQDKSVEQNEDYRRNVNVHFDKDTNIRRSEDSRAMSPTAEEMSVDNVDGDHTTLAVFSSMNVQRPNRCLSDGTSRGNSLQKISKSKISQQLHEMNEQFDAIEQLTSNMEEDLQRSNRLLRTIENLNKITDEKAEVKKKSVRTRKSIEESTHNMAASHRRLSNAINIQDDDLSLRKETRPDIPHGDKLSVLKTRPWINKPIEELTEFVSDDRTNERNLDSLENSREKENTNDETFSDVLLQTRPVDADADTRNTEGYTGPTEDGQSRRSSITICTTMSHDHPEVVADTARSDRLKLSLTPEDVLNVSRERLKDVLAGTTTPTVPNIRSRNVTPQKQQELREWMSKKRKLRHKQWTQQLNEKRETEFKPFQSKIQAEKVATSSKKLKISEKEREDNRRTQKKEHVDERLLSAYDLINEMVTDHAPNKPVLITQSSVRDPQRKAAKRATRVNNRYKENRGMKSKRPKGKSSLKTPTEFHRTRTIHGQAGLTGFSSPVGSERERKQSNDAPVYDYDIEQSARQFITRKSFETYQQKMSRSFDFDRSISLRASQHSLDPRVDELIEDVSLGDSLDLQRLDHLDSLLSGDSELRDLLNDVIPNKPSRDLLETRDDGVLSRNSTIPRNAGNRWTVSRMVENREILESSKMDRKENREKNSEGILMANEDDNLEMSDELAALLAEAKAAVGDDFSGTSEVGDIDWNEVDEVLQQHN